MKMKIQALYLTGTALLIGAAGVGDSVIFDTVGSWTGRGHPGRADGRRRHRLLGLWPGSGDRAGGEGAAAPVLPEAEELPEGSGREERQTQCVKEKSAMVRIEMKKIAEGQVMLATEAKRNAG